MAQTEYREEYREADYLANVGKTFLFRLSNQKNTDRNGDYALDIIEGVATPFALTLRHPDGSITSWPSEQVPTPGLLLYKGLSCLTNTARFLGLADPNEDPWVGADFWYGSGFEPLEPC